MRQVKLERESELRVEVGPDAPLHVSILTGSAEIFGTEVAPKNWISFPPKLRFALFTWVGAIIELDGVTVIEDIAHETPMSSYADVHTMLETRRRNALSKASPNLSCSSQKAVNYIQNTCRQRLMEKGPRIIVVGPKGSGKTTLCRMLLSWAAKQGWKPTFLDLNTGQVSINIPGCISATQVEMPIDPVEGIPYEAPIVYFYGHTSPSVNVGLYKMHAEELSMKLERVFARNAESREAGMVIDTMGWVKDLGYELLLHAIKTFSANVVLVLDDVSASY